jgi:hypothetical protein
MKTQLRKQFIIFVYSFSVLFPLITRSQTKESTLLKQEFNLAGERSQEIQFYVMKSECINYALNGKRLGKEIYKIYLKWVPAKIAEQEDDQMTCVKFTAQLANATEVTIPSLENWSYSLNKGIDEKNQVFGINHDKFENLKDSNGNMFPSDKAYYVYNAFIDFHALCNIIAEPSSDGNGIQNLKKIGQKIVHSAAFSEPPTHLGKIISEGSSFKNGEITLEFKGLSMANDRECSLIGIDSGESSFKMIVKPTPKFEVVAVGSSHYKGDIYKDLASNWVQKVTFDEIVVTEATMPIPPNKVNAVVERNVMIRNVSEAEFLKD